MPFLQNFGLDPGGAYPGEFTPKQQTLDALSKKTGGSKSEPVRPEITVRETAEYYKVELSAQGIKRENLLVSINESGDLCIFGYEMENEGMVENHKHVVCHSFKEQVPLPDRVDSSFTSARCHAGLLSILFTKSDKPVKRRPSTIVVY